MFSNFDKEKVRPVKSLKISRDSNHGSKGFAFVCYKNAEDATKACELLGESATRKECVAVKYGKDGAHKQPQESGVNNNLYVRGFPNEFNEDDVRQIFAPFGILTSVAIKRSKKGSCAFVCYQT
jgi:polyadenylate-binding protein